MKLIEGFLIYKPFGKQATNKKLIDKILNIANITYNDFNSMMIPYKNIGTYSGIYYSKAKPILFKIVNSDAIFLFDYTSEQIKFLQKLTDTELIELIREKINFLGKNKKINALSFNYLNKHDF